MNSFIKTTDLLHRALDVNALRYTVTANNLANAEVPEFKRTEVSFESELKRALDSEKNKDGFFEQATKGSNLLSDEVIDYRSVEPRRVLDYISTVKANGNNVDAEEEAMNILKIQMQYQLLSQMAGFQYSQVQSVLR
ncbi:flagellar basal body rod protein FlgB [Treponema phagedenis]|uniref:Flagellar basal body rod protein FlgB n=1 Tax=Treponema phagedenis TaxID=162 RepID=A0A0B7GVY0_TREPH|nr:flagellar basal body rod protein FlgB [Treponema phagedenis]EFW39282.1 flagellar basal-body rod protein FlgB [Treponema phagedenis F0421]NVP24550.1 flagellar basal body rod protein FlgB [Treponema phagedenis]QEJ94753.1 flagellar basal body rod protein FlgB [Treponema phagedenis]QEJ97690.1 flagellar basal body rod protein FlgB [Treponema phagedenis]QEK00659.1 flagellar basal body rod protein FlgB [Treponema phagedenis]